MTSFRFGAVSGAHGDARSWGESAQRLEDAGYSALLVPDTLYTPSPFPALAAAAVTTSTLHLGTWVLAAPLRTPEHTLRETRALVELSNGRFELGLGAGRPQAEQDAAALNVPWGSARDRVDRVQAVLEATRAAFGSAVPITLAASGDRMLRLAGRHAHAVALPLAPTADLDAVAATAKRVREATPAERPPLELSLQVVGVGDDVPEWLRRTAGITPEQLRDSGAIGMLSGDPSRDADALLALRAATGVSYITLSEEYAQRLAPLVAALSGS
ncbi:LLM class flavin-dependent oxidoreductase [Humibacter sp. RRB41]|uniref:LLM class flavin-dependent oxidoreductase n=1 Tax=Humibacter sp. RRB41 TaxID=2919946 RepID=UPI001FAAF171|nr:LLM class flavin-dependent oxidoreductase [Humibacter sp. RRB41]